MSDRRLPIVKHQPIRPATDDEGFVLNYRVHPKEPNGHVRFCTYEAIVAQATLYRWASDESRFANMVPIDDLHQHLFWDRPYVTKRIMGMMMHQSVTYDPKKLKGRTKETPKPVWCHSFWRRLDLVYGLEWMLTDWLIQMMDKPTTEGVEIGLERLKSADDEGLQKIFDKVSDLIDQRKIKERNWEATFAELNLTPHPEPIPLKKVYKRSLWQLKQAAKLKGLQIPEGLEAMPDAEGILIGLINGAPGMKV